MRSENPYADRTPLEALALPSFWCRPLRLNLRSVLAEHNLNGVGLAVVEEVNFLLAQIGVTQLFRQGEEAVSPFPGRRLRWRRIIPKPLLFAVIHLVATAV